MAPRPVRKKRPAATARAFKRRKVSSALSDDDEGVERESTADSQQDSVPRTSADPTLILIGADQVVAIKKKKQSSSESHLAVFSRRVAADGESLAAALRKERLEKKADAGAFSEQFGALVSRALSNAPVHSHPLRVYEENLFALSTGLLGSTGSLQSTLSGLLARELEIGRGWGEDGEDAIQMLVQSRLSTEAKVLATISDSPRKTRNEGDGDGNEGSEVEERKWKNRAKRSMEAIGNLANIFPLPIPDTAAQTGFQRKKGGSGRS